MASGRQSLIRRLQAVAAAAVVLAALVYAFARPPAGIAAGKLDLDAFYCAGEVMTSGGDPYRYGPMHACETRYLAPSVPQAAVPAPFPPYAIAGFSLLSKLSFARAALLWELLTIAAAATIVMTILELTGLPLLLVGTCTFVAVLVDSVAFGALAPIPIALLCLAALSIVRRRWTLATVLLALSCVEPHLALPPIAAAFILIPQMRLRLLCAGALLLAVTLAAGLPLNVEYVREVLPAHAASELGTANQLSLSTLLHTFGASQRVALTLGTAQYALFAAGAIAIAAALRKSQPVAIVLLPMALATVGGTFVHASELVAIAPVAWAIAARVRSAIAWTGLTLALVPWDFIAQGQPPSALFAGIIVFTILAYHRRFALGAAAAVLVTALWWVLVAGTPGATIGPIAPVPPGALTEAAWQALASQAHPTWLTVAAHALTYLGIALLAAAALRDASPFLGSSRPSALLPCDRS